MNYIYKLYILGQINFKDLIKNIYRIYRIFIDIKIVKRYKYITIKYIKNIKQYYISRNFFN